MTRTGRGWHSAQRLPGLLWRSTLAVLAASLLAAAFAVAYSARSTSERAQAASQTRLNELLDTVQSTLAVACFAQDQTLAGELAQGLLSNSDVLAIRISTGIDLLAERHRLGVGISVSVGAAGALVRPIYSPFDASKLVGQIVLTPDPQVIEARIREEVTMAAIQLSWQLAMLTAAVVLIMLLFIVRPIKAMSAPRRAMPIPKSASLPLASMRWPTA